MPKKLTTESGEAPTGKEIRLPSDNTLKSFNSAYTGAVETIDEAKQELKDAADVAIGKHLYLPAFKVVKGLYDRLGDGEAKNAEKLAMWLAHFDKYRKYYKLDELANLQGRLFGEGEIGGEAEAGEDGEKDLRPRHLRQPGASVTSAEVSPAVNAVRDLATKTGATLTNPDEDPVNKVGRGKLN